MVPNNNKPESNNNNETKPALTPDELLHRHMQNPDEPITDEDINNLVLDIDVTTEDANSIAEEKEKKIIHTPYEVLK